MHADAIIAIAASKDSRALTREVFGDEIGWLPWKRPGYELGLWLEKFCRENPEARGVVLESHGLFTWGDDAKGCYDTTIEIINRAIAWLETRTAGRAAFGGEARPTLAPEQRRRIAAALMPRIRGMISKDARMVGHFDDGEAVLEFVGSKEMAPLAALGTSCPDHFLRTKIRPLVVDFDPGQPDLEATLAGLPAAVEAYRARLCRLLRALPPPDSPACATRTRSSISCPGVGMITFAKDKATARISRRVLRQRHQRDARRLGGLGVPGPARAGGLRHRVLAARGGEAAADAEAEEPRRPYRHHHRRRRRHRRRDGRAAAARGRLRRARRHRRARRWTRPRPRWRRGTRRTWCGPSR